VLRWALAGCRAWLAQGIGEAERITEATRVYRKDSDILANWFEDECEHRPNQATPVKQVKASYFAWCHRTGERPLSARSFSDMLVAKGYPSKPVTRFRVTERCFVGLKLKNAAVAQAADEIVQEAEQKGERNAEPF